MTTPAGTCHHRPTTGPRPRKDDGIPIWPGALPSPDYAKPKASHLRRRAAPDAQIMTPPNAGKVGGQASFSRRTEFPRRQLRRGRVSCDRNRHPSSCSAGCARAGLRRLSTTRPGAGPHTTSSHRCNARRPLTRSGRAAENVHTYSAGEVFRRICCRTPLLIKDGFFDVETGNQVRATTFR